jgi:hypothetical protein
MALRISFAAIVPRRMAAWSGAERLIAGTSRASALPCWAKYPIAWAIMGLLAVQVHLAMYHMLYVVSDERYRSSGVLDRRPRAGRALTDSGAFAAAAALEDLKFRHLKLRAGVLFTPAARPEADAEGENSSTATPAERTVAGAPVVPAGSAEDEEEPRLQWEGERVDFGKPADDSLIRMRVDSAVAAGLRYIGWDRWRWRRRCGEMKEELGGLMCNNSGAEWGAGARVRPGADPKRIKYVRIWGERNSCTTMVTGLLLRNLALNCNSLEGCVSGGLPNKHDFLRGANVHNHEETLHILVSRHPYEWLASMRQHPYYAGLHYNKSMIDFLTQEWASFRLRELDDKSTKKSPATLREGKITVEWGKARSVGPCSSAGRLNRMHKCDRSEGVEGGSEESMRCTRIPGLVPSMFQKDQDAGAGMLGEAASLCMNATESLKHCSDEMFLCSVGRSFHPWDRNGWRAHLESALHAREKMQPAGAAISTRRNGVLCFRKIGDIVAKMKDDVCAPDKQTVGASCAVVQLRV